MTSNGIAEDKKNEFYNMFVSKPESYEQMRNCEDIVDALSINPQITKLTMFMDAYLGNTYKTLSDLFFSNKNQAYIPTGTCPPFYKKLFLTVNGKILSCEKIGQDTLLGYVDSHGVSLNINEINSLYSKLYEDVISKCRKCSRWKNCGVCIYHLPKDKDGKIRCPYICGTKEISNYFSEYISILENTPELYEQIVNGIMVAD